MLAAVLWSFGDSDLEFAKRESGRGRGPGLGDQSQRAAPGSPQRAPGLLKVVVRGPSAPFLRHEPWAPPFSPRSPPRLGSSLIPEIQRKAGSVRRADRGES